MAELDTIGVWLSSVAWMIVSLVAGVVVGIAAFLCWSVCARGAREDRMAEKFARHNDAD